jgi:hypothetical protein
MKSDIEPTWEMTNQQLAFYLEMDITLVQKLSPQDREMYVRLAWVEHELKAGRKPAGVLVCED